MQTANHKQPKSAMNCPHCQSRLLWSEDRGAHCDGCDDFDESSLAVPIGKAGKTHRGFPLVEFSDAYGHGCSLICSSMVGDCEDSLERPGSSYLWIGIDRYQANPQILTEDRGWVKYPIPKEVSLCTQMHVNRDQVRGLIARLQQWLDTGTFEDGAPPSPSEQTDAYTDGPCL